MKANKVILKRGLVVFVVLVALLALVSMAGFAAFQPPAPAAERIDVLIGFEGAPNPGLVRAFDGEIYAEFDIVDVIGARMSERQANALRRNPAVSYIEPDGTVYTTAQTVPWGIDRVFGNEKYEFPTWNNSSGGGIGVAVLDTGIDRNHEDLTVIGGRRFYLQGFRLRSDNNYNDVHGHGTHVAGTIAALNNNVGVVGVAPAADLYAVKVLTDSGSGQVSAIVAGIEWVVNHGNIQIINMSLGSSSYSQTFKDACDKADAAGILVISSAGNTGNAPDNGDNVGYPAKYDSVVAVAASDINNNLAWFSSTGPAVELIAPGLGVLSTYPGNSYRTASGTSMASPHVAGVAALVWAADRSLSNEDVRVILQDTAEDLGLPENHQGYGLVRADLAVGGGGAPTVPVTGVSINQEDPSIDVGSTVQLTATVLPVDATKKEVTWSTDDKTVATVDAATGLVTGVSAGDAIITVTTEDGGKTDSITVTVTGEQDSALKVKVATDRDSYTGNSWVYVTVVVTNQIDQNVQSAEVAVTINYPDGTEAGSFNGTTNADGRATFRYRVANRSAEGTYNVYAEASKGGIAGNDEVDFHVKLR